MSLAGSCIVSGNSTGELIIFLYNSFWSSEKNGGYDEISLHIELIKMILTKETKGEKRKKKREIKRKRRKS